MKPKNIIAIGIFLISLFFVGAILSATNIASANSKQSIINVSIADPENDYTYEEVYTDGHLWMYVYYESVFIDRYVLEWMITGY